MAIGTRSKRAQSVTTHDDGNAPRPTKRGRKEGETKGAVDEEEDPDDQLDQEDEEDAGRQDTLRSSGRGPAESSDDPTEHRREFILSNLPELASQAEKMMVSLSGSIEERQKAWNKHSYLLKSRYFRDLKEPFEEPQGFPFIDTDKLEFVPFTDRDVMNVGFVNLATALDIIDQIQVPEEDVSTLEFLTQLDDFLHKLFRPFNYGDSLEVSLNIRTVLFIKALEEEINASKNPIKRNKVNDLLGEYFIDPPALEGKPNYSQLFVNGPYKDIGHIEDEVPDTQCERRITGLFKTWNGAAKGAGLAKLQEQWPLSEMLDGLRSNTINVYDSARIDARAVSQTQEQFHDAQEDVDDLESVTDSQPIVRATTKGRSFFTGPEAFRALDHQSAPPSNQEAPVEDSNSAILGPRPSSVAPSTTADTRRPASTIPHRQRMNPSTTKTTSNTGNNDDEEEEDAFEEDSRPVNKEKAADITQTLRSRSQPLSAAAPSSMPPPPRPSAHQPSSPQQPQQSPPSSAFDIMRQEKALLAAQARRSPPGSGAPPIKQRTQWSDADTYTLINLVAKCHGSWSQINNSHNHRFEHPRNQQAYRDKARNIKVDLLSTDKILPPCFDLVALSSKEVNQVKRLGKNPYRLEKDLDDEMTPVNTELPNE